jgi:hypothetical protein
MSLKIIANQKNVYSKIYEQMEQRTFKNVNNCLKTNIYSYLETSGSKSYNIYLNVVHFFNTSPN